MSTATPTKPRRGNVAKLATFEAMDFAMVLAPLMKRLPTGTVVTAKRVNAGATLRVLVQWDDQHMQTFNLEVP